MALSNALSDFEIEEFSPDIVMTSNKKPDRIEKTFATRFNASLLFVKLFVRYFEKKKEARKFPVVIIIPVQL